MPPTPPLRTAIIGLSSTNPSAWAPLAYLPLLSSPSSSPRLTLTALCNSSISAAKAAITAYSLPSTTKTYGDPEALAADPDIDLVLCATRVDQHYAGIMPSIRAGKDVFVEWPVASSIEEIRAVADAAKKSGSRVAVDLQRRWSAPAVALRNIVKGGKLGKVLSADFKAVGMGGHRSEMGEKWRYLLDLGSGGNGLTIGFAHTIDLVTGVVGELDPGSVSMRMQLLRPEVSIMNAAGEAIETVRSDIPDLLNLTGTLALSAYTDPNATLTFSLRKGQSFPGDNPGVLSINCERGEIRFSFTAAGSLTFDDENPAKIRIHHYEDDRVEDIAWAWPDLGDGVKSGTPKSVEAVLYPFVDGEKAGEAWLDIEGALEKAEWIDGFLRQWKKQLEK